MAELKKNQIIELEITATGSQGEGIGRYDGLAVFVPAAAEGDRLSVRIVKVQKNLAYGRIEKILSPSLERIDGECEAFPQCGGCAYRHISYEAECRIKRQRVTDAMQRIGGIDIVPERFIPCAPPDRYRNKAQLPCSMTPQGEIRFGFYAGRSHRIVGCTDCLLQPESFASIARTVKRFMGQSGNMPYDEETHTGTVRHLYIRRSRATGDIMVCLVINGEWLKREELLVSMLRDLDEHITGILININRARTNVILGSQCRLLWGRDYITDTLLGVDFRISPLSFFQVNPAQAEKLYAVAGEYAALTGGETVLDMYCGAGTIGLTMASRAGCIIGAEVVPEAVDDARMNARLNGVENAEFICADASEAARNLAARGIAPNVVVLDPPRKGCDESLIRTVAQMSPARVVYVSCDPATLARDVKIFSSLGYNAQRLTAVDMFARTSHVECVALLTKVHN